MREQQVFRSGDDDWHGSSRFQGVVVIIGVLIAGYGTASNFGGSYICLGGVCHWFCYPAMFRLESVWHSRVWKSVSVWKGE